ncbi:MAG: NTP transferase domain-containing protein [Deltaproteobacteria bacterium]|nr:NTP transferase domain-containing protein [Deltaproteobacteria bacterium]
MTFRTAKKAVTPNSPTVAVVILAAGQGKRLKSAKPKVLHELMGRTLLDHVLHAVSFLKPERTVVVTGVGAEVVESSVKKRPGLIFARQTEQLGTGHAVAAASSALADFSGPVFILPGDVPMISPQTLLDFLAAHKALKADLSCLTVCPDDPAAYGRIIRDEAGWLSRIVEARDATEEELAIGEINTGLYIVDAKKLFTALADLKPNNVQGEYYLTDAVAGIRGKGYKTAAVLSPDPDEAQGINDRLDLARAQSIARARINAAWLTAGVTMADPSTTHIEASVRLSSDVTLGPGVVLTGATKIESGAVLGPYVCLHDCFVSGNLKLGPGATYSGAVLRPARKISGHRHRGWTPNRRATLA